MKKTIVHVADIEVTEESGMGRIAWHWKNEIERRGYNYFHIGPTQVGAIPHRGLFPYAAYGVYQRLGHQADAFLVHEASSGPFLNRKVPAIVFSHGSDRRSWNLSLAGGAKVSLKSRIIFPLWRLRHCDSGYRKGNMLLLSNYEDLVYAQEHYHRNPNCAYIFKNGVYSSELSAEVQPEEPLTVSFFASWIPRKGTWTLIKAAQILQQRGLHLNWLLAGTGTNREEILSQWPKELHADVEVIARFPRTSESSLLARTNIFVLPSYYEGQPLSLLQAMETGRCCITTDCCGQRDLIQHGENGLLYPPGDEQQLATLIEECFRDKELRLKLGRKAKASVKNRQWENTASELLDQIEKFLAK